MQSVARIGAPLSLELHTELFGLSSLSKADQKLLIRAVQAQLANKPLDSIARKKKVSTQTIAARVKQAESRLQRAVANLQKRSVEVAPSAERQPTLMVPAWTREKNDRRCKLIHKEIYDQLTSSEKDELMLLEEQVDAFQREVAPLPIDAARRLLDELQTRSRAQGAAG